MIDLTSMVALRAVDAHGSVVEAADALGFTPSAVSQQVKRLERQVGLPLLERVGRGVMLTHAGRHLVDEGSRLLADMEALESGLHEQATTVAGRLRLTAFSTAMRGLIAPVARDLLAAHPGLALTLSEREPWDTVDLVATGHSEIGVVHSWGDVPLSIPDHLVTTELHRDVADMIVHRDHPLAQLAKVTPHDLVGESWIATPEGTICHQWLNRMYAGTGHLPQIAHVSMEFDSHLALVRAGLGIALIPRMGRAELGVDLVAVRVVDPVPTRAILAVHRRTMGASPAVTTVLAALAGQHDPGRSGSGRNGPQKSAEASD
ncbi:DNA-binding transcriptional LysR family regulator [Nocardioides albertanoniae]|uniref:DNA-binding transcriptional LysR family regulator n=1 Tax=Nocardioides albertanoniae TaxID=1175486 RepID=A0A543A4K5_9ACTN|nr:LysR family transcriptional regulator [Nocardioides albertanoniae]TQL67530.1 DNA-binding transcriptional LysR family regulator [Nocardioides albertanoniae]